MTKQMNESTAYLADSLWQAILDRLEEIDNCIYKEKNTMTCQDIFVV